MLPLDRLNTTQGGAICPPKILNRAMCMLGLWWYCNDFRLAQLAVSPFWKKCSKLSLPRIGMPFMAASEPDKINSAFASLLDIARGGIKRESCLEIILF